MVPQGPRCGGRGRAGGRHGARLCWARSTPSWASLGRGLQPPASSGMSSSSVRSSSPSTSVPRSCSAYTKHRPRRITQSAQTTENSCVLLSAWSGRGHRLAIAHLYSVGFVEPCCILNEEVLGRRRTSLVWTDVHNEPPAPAAAYDFARRNRVVHCSFRHGFSLRRSRRSLRTQEKGNENQSGYSPHSLSS